MLFCTTCCAQGVDCPVVSSVLITFMPSSITQLQQMICRAGRDGCNATATLFATVRNRIGENDETFPVYNSTGCIRARIGQLLDGELAKSCKIRETFCTECVLRVKRNRTTGKYRLMIYCSHRYLDLEELLGIEDEIQSFLSVGQGKTVVFFYSSFNGYIQRSVVSNLVV